MDDWRVFRIIEAVIEAVRDLEVEVAHLRPMPISISMKLNEAELLLKQLREANI